MSDLKTKHVEEAKRITAGQKIPLLINGEFVTTQKTFSTIDPTIGEEIAEVCVAGESEVNLAVETAQRSFESWSELPPRERAKYLKKFADVIKDVKDYQIAEILDSGLPRSISSRLSFGSLRRAFEYYAEWCDKITSDVISISSQSFDFTLKEPFGVVAVITSWNVPGMFLGPKVAPALAAGNTVVIKPSEYSPLPAYVFSKIAKEVFPPGVVNVVFGGADTGRFLVSHKDVWVVSFTGGTEIGELIAKQGGIKKYILELGGKSPNIIFEDANLDSAVFMSSIGMFSLSGQMCAASSRIFVHKKIYQDFVERFVNVAKGFSVGDPFDPAVFAGPLISQKQLERVESFVDEGKRAGGRILFGGSRISKTGYFFEPTIFVDVPHNSKLAQEEVFGPVLTIFDFESEDEVVKYANSTKYGLSAAVFTKDISKAIKTAKKLRAGTVWINTYGIIPHNAPWGGYKMSGVGREGGKEGIEELLQIKNVYVQL
ncbi:MAG: aldehyde dehydrogenase family protein [bacterium]|nr:aldehyde dehydrogenase family protein [bacterium]